MHDFGRADFSTQLPGQRLPRCTPVRTVYPYRLSLPECALTNFRVHIFGRLLVGLIKLSLATLCAAWLAGCTDEQPRPNLVLITVDTLRADRLGCYGADVATPHIDRLASEGTVFLNAASPMPSTRPAHFSILSSLYPRDHGVTSNALSLPPEIQTLPQLFETQGYRTGGFTGVGILAPGSGAERGFEVFQAPENGARSAREVVSEAIDWLSNDHNRPFFLWVHVYDPHLPYLPPDGTDIAAPPEIRSPGFSRTAIWPLLENNSGDLPRSLFDYALDLYRSEVEYVDRQLGGLLDTLRRRDDFERTAILLTADHGECFENGIFFEHGGCLGDGAIQVPLILRYPPAVAAPQRVETQVELVDIAPTLLEIADLTPPDEWAGKSLLNLDQTPHSIAYIQHTAWTDRALLERRSRREIFKSVAGAPLRPIETIEQFALRTPVWKYVLSPNGEELYNLEQDPGESAEVAADHPETLGDLRTLLRRWLAEHPGHTVATDETDSDLERTLEALGYL